MKSIIVALAAIFRHRRRHSRPDPLGTGISHLRVRTDRQRPGLIISDKPPLKRKRPVGCRPFSFCARTFSSIGYSRAPTLSNANRIDPSYTTLATPITRHTAGRIITCLWLDHRPSDRLRRREATNERLHHRLGAPQHG